MSKLKSTEESKKYIQVISADFWFSIQRLFQEQGVTFIDTNNGRPVTGQVYYETLGMVTELSSKTTTPEVVDNRNKYLLPPKETPSIYDVEATINMYQPKSAEEPISFTIQVVDQNDLEKWKEIALAVHRQVVLPTLANGEKELEPVFLLIPLSLPDKDDPSSAISLILGNLQGYKASDAIQDDLNLAPIQPYYLPNEEEF